MDRMPLAPRTGRCRPHDAGPVVAGVFVVAGGDASPALEPVERPLDDVAVAVQLGVEARWPAATAALGRPVGDLVALLGDDHADSPATQGFPGRGVGVSLVGDDAVRAASRRSTDPSGGDPDVVDQRQELRIVAGLARGEPHREGSSPAVDAEVVLGAPPASGATQRVVLGLRGSKPVIRPCPLWGSGALRRHADVPWPRWSRPRRPTPSPRPRGPGPAARATPDPRCRPWPTGRNVKYRV